MEPGPRPEDDASTKGKDCYRSSVRPSYRWVTSRKADVLTTILSGRMILQQACRIYGISVEELTAWQEAFIRRGHSGLYATRRNGIRPAPGVSNVTLTSK